MFKLPVNHSSAKEIAVIAHSNSAKKFEKLYEYGFWFTLSLTLSCQPTDGKSSLRCKINAVYPKFKLIGATILLAVWQPKVDNSKQNYCGYTQWSVKTSENHKRNSILITTGELVRLLHLLDFHNELTSFCLSWWKTERDFEHLEETEWMTHLCETEFGLRTCSGWSSKNLPRTRKRWSSLIGYIRHICPV